MIKNNTVKVKSIKSLKALNSLSELNLKSQKGNTVKVTPINSLSELSLKSQNGGSIYGDQYKQLVFISASNLGLETRCLDAAINWLYTNANETGEEGVVEEVNFCIPMLS